MLGRMIVSFGHLDRNSTDDEGRDGDRTASVAGHDAFYSFPC